MLDDAQKLFDKSFAVGSFLPSLLYLGGASIYLQLTGRYPPALKPEGGVLDWTALTALYAAAAWALGVFLVALNRTIIRFLEGYPLDNLILGIGVGNPLRLFAWMEIRRFRRLQEKSDRLEGDPEKTHEYASVLIEQADSMPHEEHLVLPTRFGNVLRAYEAYPLVMYGFDLVTGWYRLAAVLPEDMKQELRELKAYQDFWINLAVFCLVGIAWPVMVPATWSTPVPWLRIGVGAGLLALLAAIFVARASEAAKLRGHAYKSAVDLYLPDLAKRLGADKPEEAARSREFWQAFSQAITYRNVESLRTASARGTEGSSGRKA